MKKKKLNSHQELFYQDHGKPWWAISGHGWNDQMLLSGLSAFDYAAQTMTNFCVLGFPILDNLNITIFSLFQHIIKFNLFHSTNNFIVLRPAIFMNPLTSYIYDFFLF